jgi:two-component system, NarL family, nitrate/nitrite response regulator NarL
MTKKVRILIVDDHEIIHNGIKDILRSEEEYDIVGHAFDGQEAIEKTKALNPDLIMMDISMPIMNGIEAVKAIKELNVGARIIALTQHSDNEYITEMFKAGANGYLLKNSRKDEFIEAIETVLKKRRYLSYNLSEQLINSSIDNNKQAPASQETIHLTRREIEIIQKIAEDKNNQEIADELFISLRTVETHRRNLMQKLKVKSVVAIIKYAVSNKLIDL